MGLHGNVGQSIYSATKAALVGFTKSLAKELGPKNIVVNMIAPGFIDVGMTEGTYLLCLPYHLTLIVVALSKEQKESILANTSLKRFGTANDVTSAALFLAESNYITGQVIVVDGGLKL